MPQNNKRSKAKKDQKMLELKWGVTYLENFEREFERVFDQIYEQELLEKIF